VTAKPYLSLMREWPERQSGQRLLNWAESNFMVGDQSAID